MTDIPTAPVKREGRLWAASFDMGSVNYCFHVAELNPAKLKEICKPRIEYAPNGECTDEMDACLTQVFKATKSVIFHVADLKEGLKAPSTDRILANLTQLLMDYHSYFEQCDFFLIEKQMAFRGISNPLAVRLAHHTESYFMFRFGHARKVIEYPAYHKTQILGAAKVQIPNRKGEIKWTGIDKAGRKKWTVVKAQEIFQARGEEGWLEWFMAQAKKDDLADVLCQLCAYIYKTYAC